MDAGPANATLYVTLTVSLGSESGKWQRPTDDYSKLELSGRAADLLDPYICI